MSVTFNSTDAVSRSGFAVGAEKALGPLSCGDGLLISPETSSPAESQFLASVTLFLIGLGLVAATIVFVAALIATALA